MRDGKQNSVSHNKGEVLLICMIHSHISKVKNMNRMRAAIARNYTLTLNELPFLTYFRNSNRDHFHSLSDCARCSLPLLLMLSGSSRNPPFTPLDATSWGKSKAGECSFQRPDQTAKVIWKDCVSLTMTVRVGGSLDARLSVDTCEVKFRLEVTGLLSEEPRSIGWPVLVRLMVLWLLNGREGWSLSQSACRQGKGRK